MTRIRKRQTEHTVNTATTRCRIRSGSELLLGGIGPNNQSASISGVFCFCIYGMFNKPKTKCATISCANRCETCFSSTSRRHFDTLSLTESRLIAENGEISIFPQGQLGNVLATSFKFSSAKQSTTAEIFFVIDLFVRLAIVRSLSRDDFQEI